MINIKRSNLIISILVVFTLSAIDLTLTDPQILRSTVDGGGQKSGGGYTLTGAISQPDAGIMSGGVSWAMDSGGPEPTRTIAQILKFTCR